jgi:hypothetical protein
VIQRPGSGHFAERRARSCGHERGPGSAAVGGQALADLVDPAVSRLQPPAGDPPVDGVSGKAGIEEIGPRDHPFLPSGDAIEDNVT